MTNLGMTNLDIAELVGPILCANAMRQCIEEGRAYTEVHFWRNPETDERVLTFWKITP